MTTNLRPLRLLVLLLWLTSTSVLFGQETIKSQDQSVGITLSQEWTNVGLRKDFDKVVIRAAGPAGVEDAAIYVQVYDVGRFTPESYRHSVRRYISQTMKGEVLGEQELELDGRKAWQIEYTGVSVGYAEERRHFLNTVVFDGEKIYVVHCAAVSPSWQTLESDFRAISRSMKLE